MVTSAKAWLGLFSCGMVGICYAGGAGPLYGALLLAILAPGQALLGALAFGLFAGFLYGGLCGFFAGLIAGSIGGYRGWLVAGVCGGWVLFLASIASAPEQHRTSALLWAMLPGSIAVGVGWLLSRAIQHRDARFPLVGL